MWSHHHVRVPICLVLTMPNISHLIFTMTQLWREEGNSILDMLGWRISVDHPSEVQGRDHGHGWRCIFGGCRYFF